MTDPTRPCGCPTDGDPMEPAPSCEGTITHWFWADWINIPPGPPPPDLIAAADESRRRLLSHLDELYADGPPPDESRRDATERDETRRDTTVHDGTRRNILERIDDVVEQRCACGCNTEITAESPSAYYATQDCQSAWMARGATRPHEVLGEPRAVHWRPTATEPPSEPFQVLHRPNGRWTGLAYLLRCEQCGGRREHVVTEAAGRRTARCSACDTPSARQPVYVPTVIEGARGERRGWRLVLADDLGRAERFISRTAIRNAVDPRAVVDRTWEALERDLSEFRRRWFGARQRILAEHRIGLACIDPTMTIRVTGT